jgi:CHAD domain-containing protein/CYTH domain-containing protein
MRFPERLAEVSAARGVRWLALRFLDDAGTAQKRLADPADAEALHDLRVAVRRLRSLLRAYRDALGDAVEREDRRRLKVLADATGAARDAEVHLAWLEPRLAEAPEEERAGLAFLADRQRARREAAEADFPAALRRFSRERRRLRRRVATYEAAVSLDEVEEGPPLRVAAAALIRDAVDELAAALALVKTIEDQDEAHRARIAAKRLRYLLEPLALAAKGGKELVERVKALQDVLGEMHDAHVLLQDAAAALEELREASAAVPPSDVDPAGDPPADAAAAPVAEPAPDPVPGIQAAMRALAEERAAKFAEFQAEWSPEKADEFFAGVRAFADALAGPPADVEIERKYLLKRLPRFPDGAEVQEIDQGWLPGERLAERLRRVRKNGEVKWYRTVKLGAGISRIEVEEETTEALFRKLWRLTRGKRVHKRRFRVREGALTWEVDRFRGRKLVLAEVELPSEDAAAPLPVWLRRVVVREVTGEPEYVNLNLAK